MDSVTVIGLGNMGAALARLLVAAGHPITVWNRTPAKAAPLAELGARVAADEAAAVAASQLTIVCVAQYEQVEAILDAAGDLTGRTIVNLTWGTAQDARAMRERVEARSATYLDGSILGYPQDMGTERSTILYAGDRAQYDAIEPLLRPLSRTRYAGEDAAAPNVIGSATGVVFYHTALGAYFEATAYASRFGVEPSAMTDLMDDMLELLRRSFRRAEEQIAAGSYETDQASNQIHYDAGLICREDIRSVGQSAALMGAFCDMLEPLIEAGKGDWSIASLHDELRGGTAA